MKIIEEHVSPDERLRFVLLAGDDGDLSLGFEGFPWHTHVDTLPNTIGMPPGDLLRQYVDDLLSDRLVIALWGAPGRLRDVWISNDAARDSAYPGEDEVIELRYWSGRPYMVS